MPSLNRFLPPHLHAWGWRWLPIIGTLALVFLLGGCTTTRLAYNNAPSLAFWWLDAYFDFQGEQSVRMRADLQALQAWHRKEELPLLATELSRIKQWSTQNVNAEQVCKISIDLQARLMAPLERVAGSIAAVAPTLQDAQIRHLEKEFAKRNQDWIREREGATASENMDRRFKKLVERMEGFYGRLRPEQSATLRTQMAATDYDFALRHREMLRRQQDALQVLQQLRSGKIAPAQGTAAIWGVLERGAVSPDPAYRQYFARQTQQGCAIMADLHNSMSPQQRAKFAQTLEDYQEDVRVLQAAR